MKQILETIGAGDGEGNTSSTRLLVIVVAVFYLGSKFYNAYLTKQPIAWGNDDLAMVGTLESVTSQSWPALSNWKVPTAEVTPVASVCAIADTRVALVARMVAAPAAIITISPAL